jgi:hypothetical protein
MTACQTTGSGDRSVACETFSGIEWSQNPKSDLYGKRGLLRQVIGHNAAWRGIGCR